jgi:hypothetical protein
VCKGRCGSDRRPPFACAAELPDPALGALDPTSPLELDNDRGNGGPIDTGITKASEPGKLLGSQPQRMLPKNINAYIKKQFTIQRHSSVNPTKENDTIYIGFNPSNTKNYIRCTTLI